MGVFSRFFRRQDGAAAEAAAAPEVTAESTAAEETGAEAPSADAEAPAAEAVEIPLQQSAEVAADSEAGEGART